MKELRPFLFFGLLCLMISSCSSVNIHRTSLAEDHDDYNVFHNGNIKISHESLDLYLHATNDVVIEEGEITKLPLLPIRSHKDIEPYYSEIYYCHSPLYKVSQEYFYIELMVWSKKEGYTFNPFETDLIVEEKTVLKPETVIAMEGFMRPPPKANQGGLFPYETLKKNLDNIYNVHNVGADELVPMRTYQGYAVKYKVTPPLPNEKFSIKIRGLKYLQDKVELPEIKYTSEKNLEVILP